MRKYVDIDRWHREAERHLLRDAVSLAVAFALGYALLCAVGYFIASADRVHVEEKPVLQASEPVYEPQAAVVETAYAAEPEEAVAEPAEVAEEPAEPIPVQEVAEPVPQAQPEPVQAQDGYSSDWFKQMGVVYDGGTRYTWYSQNVLPGGGLDIPGRHVDEDGYIADSRGRIAVASSDHPIGTELDTPFGPATVYDTGCASGTVDIYTDF